MTKTTHGLLLGLFGGSASFSPLSIPGLALWLDASDAATLFQDSAGTTPATADNDVVGYWGDKSGNGTHVTQATTADKPALKLNIQNGKPALYGDGGKGLYNTSVALASHAVICVFKAAAGYIVWEHSADTINNDGSLLSAIAGDLMYARRAATLSSKNRASLNDNTTRVATVEFQGAHADFKLRLNGVNQTLTDSVVNDLTPSTVTTGFYVLGRGPSGIVGIDGHLMELCAYSPHPGLAAIQQVDAYLMTKWGI